MSEIEFGTPYGKEQEALAENRRGPQDGIGGGAEAVSGPGKEGQRIAERSSVTSISIAMAAIGYGTGARTIRTWTRLAALNDYRTSNGGGWEIVPATKALANLLEAKGDAAGARDGV